MQPPPTLNYLTSPFHSPPSTYTPTSTYLCSLITPHLNVTLTPPPPNPDLRNVIHLLYLCSHPFPQLICGTLSLLHMCLFVRIVYLHVYTIVLFPFETHQLVNNWFDLVHSPPPPPPVFTLTCEVPPPVPWRWPLTSIRRQDSWKKKPQKHVKGAIFVTATQKIYTLFHYWYIIFSINLHKSFFFYLSELLYVILKCLLNIKWQTQHFVYLVYFQIKKMSPPKKRMIIFAWIPSWTQSQNLGTGQINTPIFQWWPHIPLILSGTIKPGLPTHTHITTAHR